MSDSSSPHHHRTVQEQILQKMSEAQPRRAKNHERAHQRRDQLNQDEVGNESQDNTVQPTDDQTDVSPKAHRHHRSHRKHSPKRPDKDKDSYDSETLELELPEPFQERFGQDQADPPTSPSRSRARSPHSSGRSRSVPVPSETKSRLGASFPFSNNPCPNDRDTSPERFQRVAVQYQHDEPPPPEPIRSGSVRVSRSPGRNPNNESFYKGQQQQQDLHVESSEHFIDDGYNSKTTKKVSYAVDSTRRHNETELSHVGKVPVTRTRAEYVEPQESDLTLVAASPKPKSRGPRQTSPSNNRNPASLLNPTLLMVNSVDSQSSFTGQKAADGISQKSHNNNMMPHHHSSQDSIMSGGRPPGKNYSKDVLPLPIEIPESVADIQAFRRYLSVRRGGLSSDAISFEQIHTNSPSSESLGGRRPGRPPLGMIPSRVQLSQEANRRTASLSHAIMTLALLSASICQLRFLITYSHSHTYPILNYFLIFVSIVLEIGAGIGYVLIARCSYDDERTEAIHNYLIFALFIVAVSNVILAAFTFDGNICDEHGRNPKSSYPSSNTDNSQLGSRQINQAPAAPAPNLRYNALE